MFGRCDFSSSFFFGGGGGYRCDCLLVWALFWLWRRGSGRNISVTECIVYMLMMMMRWCLMSSDVIWHIRDKLWPMPKHGSIKATYVRCMRVLAVTCHLHFWQNDRDFLRATVVTRGWNGYWNKSQHRKSTLEKKILPPFQQGFEPATFQSRVRRSNHWAIPAPYTCSGPWPYNLFFPVLFDWVGVLWPSYLRC